MRRKWKLISLARYSKHTLLWIFFIFLNIICILCILVKFPMKKVNKLFRSDDRGQEKKNLIVGKFIIK